MLIMYVGNFPWLTNSQKLALVSFLSHTNTQTYLCTFFLVLSKLLNILFFYVFM